MPERTREYYEIEFEKNHRSPIDIAREWKTYPNKIRRELKKYGYVRTKSEAQKYAIESGRHPHPTKGEKRPNSVRIKISESMYNTWKVMNNNEKQKRANLGKKQWEKMSAADKEAFRRLANDAVRRTVVDGSKLEKFIYHSLINNGYEVEFHRESLIPGQQLQVDLFLPADKIVIEVDGPSHFLPIWGEENLARNIESDDKKNIMLLTNGHVVIRIKCLVKTLSEIHKRQLFSALIKTIEEIRREFPLLENRLTYIEVV